MLPEPQLFGSPLTQMFLYFVWYSLLGWGMESVYCSVRQRRWINRGFLHLPLCPIYGVGALIMVNFFEPLTGNLAVFYVAATVVMSAWEYFVGWLLEVTTHMKYWDYSGHRIHLKGRICLSNSLCWGAIAYVAIFWIHPATVGLFARIPGLARQILALVLAAAVLADTAVTIRQLALLRKAMEKAEAARAQLEQARREFQGQLDSKRAELLENLAEKRDGLQRKADEARLQAELAKLEARSNKLVAEALERSRRFRAKYTLTSRRYSGLLGELRRRAGLRGRRDGDGRE